MLSRDPRAIGLELAEPRALGNPPRGGELNGDCERGVKTPRGHHARPSSRLRSVAVPYAPGGRTRPQHPFRDHYAARVAAPLTQSTTYHPARLPSDATCHACASIGENSVADGKESL